MKAAFPAFLLFVTAAYGMPKEEVTCKGSPNLVYFDKQNTLAITVDEETFYVNPKKVSNSTIAAEIFFATEGLFGAEQLTFKNASRTKTLLLHMHSSIRLTKNQVKDQCDVLEFFGKEINATIEIQQKNKKSSVRGIDFTCTYKLTDPSQCMNPALFDDEEEASAE